MTATMTPQDQTQIPQNEPPKNKPKGLPSPVKAVLRPILFLAIAAHGLLLVAPLPSSNKLEIPDEKETQIKITQLPPAKPSPKLSQQENKAGSGTSTSDTAGSDSASSRSDFSSSSSSSSDDGGAVASRRVRSGIGTGSQPRTYTGSFAEFPGYNPSERGCYGRPDCQTVKATTIDKVDQYFEKTLAEKDFGVKKVREDANVRVYKLRGGLEERFLTILADGQDTLYVLSARPVADLAALKESGAIFTGQPSPSPTAQPSPSSGGQPSSTVTNGQTSINVSANSTSTEPLVEIPDELFTLLDDLIPALPLPDKLPEEYSDAKPVYFAQPNLFFKLPTVTSPAQQANVEPTAPATDPQPLPGMEKAVYLLDKAPDKFYEESLSEKLSQLFEAVKEVGEFGGGKLYELKQEKKPTLYLNLLPLQKHPSGKEGTIVVLWTRDPRPPASSITGTPIPVPTPSASPAN